MSVDEKEPGGRNYSLPALLGLTLRHGQQRKAISLKRMAGSHAQAYASMRGAQIKKIA